jgi:iron complex transport system ATP-binding protein
VSAAIEAAGVVVELGGRDVVDRVSLSVGRGSVCGLLGPNGAGKTTLLRAMAGLTAVRAGCIRIQGRELSSWRRADLARELALLPQAPTLPPLFDVRSVVALGRTPYLGWFASERGADVRAIDAAMREAEVARFAARPVGELSGGEQRRVALARALAQETSILLLDEPTSSLDLRYQASTLALVRRLASERGLSALVVLHDLTLAGQFCDQVVLMAGGEVAAAGPPGEVLESSLLTAAFETPLTAMPHPFFGTPVVVHGRGRQA